MGQNNTYVPIQPSEVPSELSWDTPARNRGQMVEVSYSRHPSDHSPSGPGAKYRRTVDRSDRDITYAILVEAGTREGGSS